MYLNFGAKAINIAFLLKNSFIIKIDETKKLVLEAKKIIMIRFKERKSERKSIIYNFKVAYSSFIFLQNINNIVIHFWNKLYL